MFHYGVVIGYDLQSQQILFTSGRKQDERISFNTFLRLWERADNWAILVVPPGQVPESAQLLPYLQSVAGLEQAGFNQEAKESYQAALNKWGAHELIFIGLGNNALHEREFKTAAEWFRKALKIQPQSSLILNNYAWSLAHFGQLQEAREQALLANSYDRGECGTACADTLRFIQQHS